MATIKIRGRTEPLIVEDDVARKIKDRKFGVEGKVQKAEPNDLLEINHTTGSWSGEYGRITEIDIQREQKDTREEQRRREEEEQKRKDALWLKQTPEEKARRCISWEVAYCTRVLGKIKCDIPQEAEDRARAVRVEWFKNNPTSFRCPTSEYPLDLLPKGKSARDVLSQNMKV